MKRVIIISGLLNSSSTIDPRGECDRVRRPNLYQSLKQLRRRMRSVYYRERQELEGSGVKKRLLGYSCISTTTTTNTMLTSDIWDERTVPGLVFSFSLNPSTVDGRTEGRTDGLYK